MPKYSKKIKIPGKKAADLYAVVSESIERFLSKIPMGKFELTRLDQEQSINLKSKMFNAKLKCLDEEFVLEGELSFMALPFKSQIDEGIDAWIKKKFS